MRIAFFYHFYHPDKKIFFDWNNDVHSYESGILEDPAQRAPADMYTMTSHPRQAPEEPETIEITFENGTRRDVSMT